jgi:hypothetical protein
MKVLNYKYRFENSFVLQTDFIKGLSVDIDCKIHFLHHVDFLFSHAIKLLGLIRNLYFPFQPYGV